MSTSCSVVLKQKKKKCELQQAIPALWFTSELYLYSTVQFVQLSNGGSLQYTNIFGDAVRWRKKECKNGLQRLGQEIQTFRMSHIIRTAYKLFRWFEKTNRG